MRITSKTYFVPLLCNMKYVLICTNNDPFIAFINGSLLDGRNYIIVYVNMTFVFYCTSFRLSELTWMNGLWS